MTEAEEIALAEHFNRVAEATGRSAYAVEEIYWEWHDAPNAPLYNGYEEESDDE